MGWGVTTAPLSSGDVSPSQALLNCFIIWHHPGAPHCTGSAEGQIHTCLASSCMLRQSTLWLKTRWCVVACANLLHEYTPHSTRLDSKPITMTKRCSSFWRGQRQEARTGKMYKGKCDLLLCRENLEQNGRRATKGKQTKTLKASGFAGCWQAHEVAA